MSREKMALLLLALLITVSAWNIGAANRLCTTIAAELERAEQADSLPEARTAMNKALEIWLSAEKYTHIFIRHPEIDSCSDTFYDAIDALVSGDEDSFDISLKKLRYHLESIAGMEYVSIGNVF